MTLLERRVNLAGIVGFIAVTGCSSGGDADKPASREEASRPNIVSAADTSRLPSSRSTDSIRDDIVEHGLLASDSRRELAARFGQPDRMTSHSVMNPHVPAQTDSIVDLYYPGLHLTYYVVGDGNKEFLQTGVVSDNRYLKYPELGIGTTEPVLLRVLGEPSEREPGKYRYDCARCIGDDSPVFFYFDRGKVKRIEYSFYLD